MSDEPSEWLTAPEVAKKIGRDERAVRELLERGDFEGAYRLGAGTHWRIPSAAVEKWIEERARKSRSMVIRRKPGG